MEWDDIEDHIPNQVSGVFSGWNIQKLLENKKDLQAAREDWEKSDAEQAYLDFSITKKDLDKAVEDFENRLTRLLNTHAKALRITAYSKRWWNEEVAQARKTWSQDKRRLSGAEMRQARNAYYRDIRQAKRTCWQDFLQKDEKQNHCWTALKYTKPLQFKTTPALKDGNGYVATSMIAKEALVRKSAFPKPPNSNPRPEPRILGGTAHINISEEIVCYALMSQSASKAPGPDKINFQILGMIFFFSSQV